jgi:hypothetical protein
MTEDQKILKDYSPSEQGNLLDLRRNGAERAEPLLVPEIAHNGPRRSVSSPIYAPPKFVPFEIKLGSGEGGSYFTVGEGYVYERALSALAGENSLVLHPCDNRLDAFGELTKFGLTVGEAIFVIVKEDEFGRIIGGDQLLLGVGPADQESFNYVPGVEDGITYYKLAELVSDGEGGVRIKPFLTGSHIGHSTGLTADFRLISCPTEPEEEPIQYVRLSFISGKLHSVGEPVSTRPLAETVQEIGITPCT